MCEAARDLALYKVFWISVKKQVSRLHLVSVIFASSIRNPCNFEGVSVCCYKAHVILSIVEVFLLFLRTPRVGH